MSVLELAGDADERFVRAARLVAASIGAGEGMTVDACDELCVALEEACCSVRSQGGRRLVVEFSIDDHLHVTVRADEAEPVMLDDTAQLVLAAASDGFGVGSEGMIHLTKHFS